MANKGHDNLIPLNKRSKGEQRKIQSKGGIASGKVRKEKADLKKQLQIWLESDVAKDKSGNPMTGAELMVQVAAKEMSKGNPRYWELIRDTAGFKPIDKVQIAEVDPDVISEVDQMVNKAAKEAQKPKKSPKKRSEG